MTVLSGFFLSVSDRLAKHLFLNSLLPLSAFFQLLLGDPLKQRGKLFSCLLTLFPRVTGEQLFVPLVRLLRVLSHPVLHALSELPEPGTVHVDSADLGCIFVLQLDDGLLESVCVAFVSVLLSCVLALLEHLVHGPPQRDRAVDTRWSPSQIERMPN